MSKTYKFAQIVKPNGFIRGPFGGDLKKSIFVSQSDTTFKVYEQGVVLKKDKSIGKYYIDKEYYYKKMSRFEVKENDFLISCSGVNYGAIFQITGDFERGVINQALLIVRLNNSIVDDNFFYYYYQAYIVKAITTGTGDSTIPNFPPLSIIKNLDVILPNINIQRKIGAVLKSLDKKIQLNNNIITELEAMAKTIYDYWFVQFDFPNAEGKPYRSSGGEMVWNEQLKREIPKGWTVGILSDISNITMGQSPNGDSYNENADGMIFFQGCTDFEHRFPTTRVYTNQPSRIATQGDILLSVRAPVGTINIASVNCCIGRGLAALNSKADANSYFFCLLKGLKPLFDVINGNGTTFGALTKDILFDIGVCIPDVVTIKAFETKISKMDKWILKSEMQSRELTKLRDWLLPMLMNGQATVI